MSCHLPHTAFQRLRHMRLAVVVWLVLGMSAAFASPLLRPVRFEVVCGTHGKPRLITHDESPFTSIGKDRTSPSHSTDCVLCATNHLAPPPTPEPVATRPQNHLEQQASMPLFVISPTATPPPARAPPFIAFHFRQQSSERSI